MATGDSITRRTASFPPQRASANIRQCTDVHIYYVHKTYKTIRKHVRYTDTNQVSL